MKWQLEKAGQFLQRIRRRIRSHPESLEAVATKPFALLALPAELLLEVISHLSFEDTVYLRMTSRQFRDFIPKPSQEALLIIEDTEWAIQNELLTCNHCLRLRQSVKFADKMVMANWKRCRGRGRKEASLRFCIECGLTVPWRTPGARGYSRGHNIRVQGAGYQVCKNCRLFEPVPFPSNGPPWSWCRNGYESDRKNIDGKFEDLASWKEKYQQTAKQRDESQNKEQAMAYAVIVNHRHGLEFHGLPPSCL
ncbi:hypothetical protein BT63DRAFT_455569 [Microthyrium microscopicum]|uniref:F-box domain-containing protein n=1 Tax=Microthyrium microscopicum TaxID=703497 RepID=A0A6A6UDE3_9PEZI|nr:hypothetical protein BT63DRAFT_455569 [Microthyrium microscopicum]